MEILQAFRSHIKGPFEDDAKKLASKFDIDPPLTGTQIKAWLIKALRKERANPGSVVKLLASGLMKDLNDECWEEDNGALFEKLRATKERSDSIDGEMSHWARKARRLAILSEFNREVNEESGLKGANFRMLDQALRLFTRDRYDKLDKKYPGKKTVSNVSTDNGAKPPYSWAVLAEKAICSAPDQTLTAAQICEWTSETFRFYNLKDKAWQKSIGKALTSREQFISSKRPTTDPGYGRYWTFDPNAERGNKGKPTARPKSSAASNSKSSKAANGKLSKESGGQTSKVTEMRVTGRTQQKLPNDGLEKVTDGKPDEESDNEADLYTDEEPDSDFSS